MARLKIIKGGIYIMIAKFRNKINYGKIFSILAFGSFFLIWLSGHNLTWAQKEGYPNKPVKIVVPFNPGGFTDLSIRTMTAYLSQELGVPVVIVNKGGANGMIGAGLVLKARPDGYTILAGADPPLIYGPLASPNPGYDPFKDFLPLGGLGASPHVFTVHASSPFKTVADFVNGAKKNPGKLTAGLTQLDARLMFAKFKKAAGVDVKIIPFQRTSELISALLGKHVDLMGSTWANSRAYVEADEIRMLFLNFPVPGYSTPTFAEAGYPEAQTTVTRNGLLVSAKTPKPIYEKLVLTIERLSKNPELSKKWVRMGLMPDYKNPTEFTADLKRKWDIVSKLMKEMGLGNK